MGTNISDYSARKSGGAWEHRVYFYERGDVPVIIMSSERLLPSDALKAALKAVGKSASC